MAEELIKMKTLMKDLTVTMSDGLNTLEKERTQWERQKEVMKRCEFDDIVALNVGGCHFRTTLGTLTTAIPLTTYDEERDEVNEVLSAEHMLAVMFSGNFDVARDENDRMFIDRDGTHFRYILNYLRAGGDVTKACIPLENAQIARELREEAEFYGLQDLVLYLDGGDTKGDSTIFSGNDKGLSKRLSEWLKEECKKARIGKLLYRGSRDGFGASTFHSKCDNLGATMTIVRSTNDCIFGGFSDTSWNSNGEYLASNGSWLFLLKRSGMNPQKLRGRANQSAQYCSRDFGPTFGRGKDLRISNNCNSGISMSYLGQAYVHGGDPHLFTGSQQFVVREIEVFSVKNYH